MSSQAQSGLAHGTLQSTFRLPRLKMRSVAATKCMSALKWLDNVMVSLHCWLVMFTHPVWNLRHEENFLNSTRGNISTRCFRTEPCKNHGFACLTDVWQLFHVTQNALRALWHAIQPWQSLAWKMSCEKQGWNDAWKLQWIGARGVPDGWPRVGVVGLDAKMWYVWCQVLACKVYRCWFGVQEGVLFHKHVYWNISINTWKSSFLMLTSQC